MLSKLVIKWNAYLLLCSLLYLANTSEQNLNKMSLLDAFRVSFFFFFA